LEDIIWYGRLHCSICHGAPVYRLTDFSRLYRPIPRLTIPAHRYGLPQPVTASPARYHQHSLGLHLQRPLPPHTPPPWLTGLTAERLRMGRQRELVASFLTGTGAARIPRSLCLPGGQWNMIHNDVPHGARHTACAWRAGTTRWHTGPTTPGGDIRDVFAIQRH